MILQQRVVRKVVILLKRKTVFELAEEIRNLDLYEAMDNDETIETIAEQINNDPLAVIQYLLNYIDEM